MMSSFATHGAPGAHRNGLCSAGGAPGSDRGARRAGAPAPEVPPPPDPRAVFGQAFTSLTELADVVGDVPDHGMGWQLEADGTLSLYEDLPPWPPAERLSTPDGLMTLGYFSHAPWASLAPRIRRVACFPQVKAYTLSGAFANCVNLVDIEHLDWLDVSSVARADALCAGCTALVGVDVPDLHAPALQSLNDAFFVCSSLAYVRLSGLIGPRLRCAASMFEGCESLRQVILDWCVCERLTNLSCLFRGCAELPAVDLHRVDAPAVERLTLMFEGCRALERVDLSGLATEHATTMAGMFRACSSLEYLDLTGLRTDRVEQMDLMFQGCEHLRYLDLSSWSPKALKSARSMFDGVPKECHIFFGPQPGLLPEYAHIR